MVPTHLAQQQQAQLTPVAAVVVKVVVQSVVATTA
jgi:hypothetical protein